MNKRYLLFILALSLLLFSCGLNNTMYNARKYFKAAQARPLNANGKPSPQAVEEYTKTIQKCGIIITENPNSKKIDDAVFLLAKALYYKGNSAFQAKDQFEALIKGFPESKHYPEAHIYLARILRLINRPAESEALLESFVRDKRHRKYHPKALLVLAEFEIEDKDYIRTQYWLQRIITDYRDTPEFKEAFFLFGKNFYEQRDYASSLSQFEKFVNTGGIPKEHKMEARYYIALNLFELGELDKSSKMISSLINDESRPEKIGQIRVLKARILLASKEPNKGETEVDDLAKTYPRSMSSAAAYYYLGDYYFYKKKDVNQAITAYNKVRSEYAASSYVPLSQDKTAALNQIKDDKKLSISGNLQQFVDYHLLAAENYIHTFALPDSALLMYDRILAAPAMVMADLDSLRLEFTTMSAKADSLEELLVTMAPKHEANPEPDELEETEEVEPDELEEDAELEISNDENEMKYKDTQTELQQTRTALASLDTKILEREGILIRLNNEFLPQVYFTKANLLKKVKANDEELQAVQNTMQTDFPQNKYTNALNMLIAGETVRLIDPEEDRQSVLLDQALGFGAAQPDSMRIILEQLTDSNYPQLALKANFRLGWMYSFEVVDSSLAKPYLNAVLAHPQGGEYAAWVRKFYDGTEFVFPKEETGDVEVDDTVIQEEAEVSEEAGQVEQLETPQTDDSEEIDELEEVEELETPQTDDSEEIDELEEVEELETPQTDDSEEYLDEAQTLQSLHVPPIRSTS